LKCLKLVGVFFHERLSVGNPVRREVGVMVIAPEDRVESQSGGINEPPARRCNDSGYWVASRRR
jgi:hypothetical protein